MDSGALVQERAGQHRTQPSVMQLVVQAVAFTVIGAVVYIASRLLRCRPLAPAIPNPRRSAVHGLVAVALSVTALALLMLRQYRRHGPTPGSGPSINHLADLIPQLVVLAVYLGPLVFFALLNREPLRALGITTRCLWQAILIGLGLALLTFYFQPGGFWAKARLLHAHHALALVYYAFVGFGEETLFRGYLQNRLVAWLGTWQGWVLASATMASVHFPHTLLIEGQSVGDAFLASAGLVPVSLLMGFVMLRTGNVIAPGLFHTFANWVTTLR